MRLVKYQHESTALFGEVEGETIHELSGSIFDQHTRTGRTVLIGDVKILPPCEPSKIIAAGLNYHAHAAEAGKTAPAEPLIFLKAPSSVIAHKEPVVLPSTEHKIDHEAELVAIIGKRCRRVKKENALEYVLGYTCGNDVSDRTIQRRDGQWCRAKSFDTFTPLGPFIETGIDPGNLEIKCLVNGEVRQHSNTSNMVFSIQALIEIASDAMTLLPGDIVMSGTPEGVAPLKPGDTCEVYIEKVGTLQNPVIFKG